VTAVALAVATPLAASLPPLVALGLVAAALVALVAFECVKYADVRRDVRHV
jgi:hypothetical protein